jgi:hypothetical protein
LTAVFALILSSVVASAHDGIGHVMGTVSAVPDTSVTVKTAGNEGVTVLPDRTTTFSKNDAKASPRDLKDVGARVVIRGKIMPTTNRPY